MKRGLFGITVIAVFLLCPARAALCDDIPEYMKSGQKDANWDGDVTRGMELYAKASGSAIFEERKDIYAEALGQFRAAYDKGCRDGLVLYKMAYINFERGLLDKCYGYAVLAEPALAETYPEHIYNTNVQYLLGYSAEDHREAIRHYRRYLEQRPGNVDTLIGLAQRFAEIGEPEEAERYLKEVENEHFDELSPYGKGEYLSARGKVAMFRGDYVTARDSFSGAFEANARPEYLWDLATVLEVGGDPEGAKRVLRSMVNNLPEGYFWQDIAKKRLENLERSGR